MGSKTPARRHICACTGCVNEATHQVGLRVWAMGQMLRLYSNCANFLMNVSVCEACQAAIAPRDCLSPEIKEKIASTLMHDMGRALPDFSTAQMNFIPIVGDPLTPEDFVRGGFAHG